MRPNDRRGSEPDHDRVGLAGPDEAPLEEDARAQVDGDGPGFDRFVEVREPRRVEIRAADVP